MAKQSIYTFAASAVSAQFDFGPGEEGIVVRFDDLTPEVRHALMVHGLKQKVADGAAIPRNTDTGRSATVSEKAAAMRAIAARLMAGEWRATGEGGGAPTGGLLFRALAELYPQRTADDLRAYLDARTEKEKAALRTNPRIAAIIERIKATRAGSGVDSDALLDALDAIDAEGEE